MKCPITGLKISQLLLAAIGGFLFIYAYEYVVHVQIMMGQYEATSDVWRSEEQMKEFFHWVLLSQFGTAFVFAILYGKFVVCRGMKMSLWFGALIGLGMGVCAFGSYAYLPIPMNIALGWFIAETLKGVGLAVVYKYAFSCCKSKCGSEEGTCGKGDGSCG